MHLRRQSQPAEHARDAADKGGVERLVEQLPIHHGTIDGPNDELAFDGPQPRKIGTEFVAARLEDLRVAPRHNSAPKAGTVLGGRVRPLAAI